jgi:enoyl-CoA hydratase/carnithine racemase
MGWRRSVEILMMGRKITVEEMENWGLVKWV